MPSILDLVRGENQIVEFNFICNIHKANGCFREALSQDVNVSLDVQHTDLIGVKPAVLNLTAKEHNKPEQWKITILALGAGHSTITANVTPANVTL